MRAVALSITAFLVAAPAFADDGFSAMMNRFNAQSAQASDRARRNAHQHSKAEAARQVPDQSARYREDAQTPITLPGDLNPDPRQWADPNVPVDRSPRIGETTTDTSNQGVTPSYGTNQYGVPNPGVAPQTFNPSDAWDWNDQPSDTSAKQQADSPPATNTQTDD